MNINFLLGRCYKKIGEYKKALKEFKKEKVFSPKNTEVNFTLARCYKRMGKVAESNWEPGVGFVKLKQNKD